MGGIGSGTGIRPNRKRTKEFVEAFSSIDACSFPFSSRKLFSNSSEGVTIQGVAIKIFEDKLRVYEPDSDCFYEISFSLTPAHYGNYRHWFRCPKCNHRRRKLSLIRMDGFPLFLCRCCLNLAYQSQNRTEGDQLIHKKWQLLHILNCNSEYVPDTAKPKNMHWETFFMLRGKIEEFHAESFEFAPTLK